LDGLILAETKKDIFVSLASNLYFIDQIKFEKSLLSFSTLAEFKNKEELEFHLGTKAPASQLSDPDEPVFLELIQKTKPIFSKTDLLILINHAIKELVLVHV
jgi:hypothetical protein